MKILVFVLLSASLALMAADQGVSGKWSGSFTRAGEDPDTAYIVIEQKGGEITGTGGPNEAEQWPIQKGKIVDGKITIEVTSPDGVLYKCTLAVEGDHLKGEGTATSGGQSQTGKLDLTRVK